MALVTIDIEVLDFGLMHGVFTRNTTIGEMKRWFLSQSGETGVTPERCSVWAAGTCFDDEVAVWVLEAQGMPLFLNPVSFVRHQPPAPSTPPSGLRFLPTGDTPLKVRRS